MPSTRCSFGTDGNCGRSVRLWESSRMGGETYKRDGRIQSEDGSSRTLSAKQVPCIVFSEGGGVQVVPCDQDRRTFDCGFVSNT